MKIFLKLTLLLSLTTSIAFAKGNVVVDIELSPAGSFQAKSNKVKGKVVTDGDKLVAIKLKVSVKSLKTGIDMRDEHLHKRISGKKIEIVKAEGKNGKGSGIIKINKIEKPFKFKYEKKGSDIEATFQLSLKEFEIKDINYMSVGVEDKVTIKATVPLK